MKNKKYLCIFVIIVLTIAFFGCQQPVEENIKEEKVSTWTKLMGVAGTTSGVYGITVDSYGNIYTAGFTTGALDGQTYTGSAYNLFLQKYNSSGVKQWTRLLGSASGGSYSYGVAVDTNGNVYAAGETYGDLDGQTHSSGSGHTDLLIVKYNSSGVKQWTRLLGIADADSTAYSITVDSAGNVYASGWTGGGLDGETLTGTSDLFIVKYNTDGNKQWTRLLGAAGVDTLSFGIKCFEELSAVSIYSAGYTSGNLGGETLTGINDSFLVKYDKDGNKQWTRLLGVSGAFTRAYGIDVDSAGNIFPSGYTSGNLDGETAAGLEDLFIIKYNSSGVKQWTKLLGTSGTMVYAKGISINSTNGDIYTTGWVTGDLDGQTKTGTNDLFVVKHDSSGVKQWTRLLGVTSASASGRSIAVDPANGNVYSAGYTSGNLDGKTKTGDEDLFIVKYSSGGVKQ